MSQNIFQDLIENYFVPALKAILSLENAPVHNEIVKPIDENISVKFLPSNTAIILQLMGQGVVASLKCIYKREFILRLFKGNAKDYNGVCELAKRFSLHNCCELIRDCWNKVKRSTLSNCWKNMRLKYSASEFSSFIGNCVSNNCSAMQILKKKIICRC